MNVSKLLMSAFVVALSGVPATALADKFTAVIDGYQQVPTLSTSGHGYFVGVVDTEAGVLKYALSYADTEGEVLQAHIHLGRPAVGGGIMVFLCSNLANGPAGTPECPPGPARVTGMVGTEGVVGPSGQGIEPGEFAEVVNALRHGAAYVNVHTTSYPPGEIRGDIGARRAFGHR